MMSPSDELLALSSVEMRRRIGTKEISPVELVEASIARIEALNPAVNAIVANRPFSRRLRAPGRGRGDGAGLCQHPRARTPAPRPWQARQAYGRPQIDCDPPAPYTRQPLKADFRWSSSSASMS